MNPRFQKRDSIGKFLAAALLMAAMAMPAHAQVMNDSIVGNNNQTATDTGVAINGSTSNSNINSNQNNLSTGSNINQNTVSPVVIAPAAQQYSGVNGGGGGAAALVMPRSPLYLPNAALGRSNFGLQFGVQNNPGVSALTGGKDSLGFFIQGALTIPFGKIPEAIYGGAGKTVDDQRQRYEDNRRLVFGDSTIKPEQRANTQPSAGQSGTLSAYNFATAPYDKIPAIGLHGDSVGQIEMQQPRVLALAEADVFTKPLNTGEKIASLEVGREYPYLGHTKSGWVKILLPDGKNGWASTRFEYIKYDYTQVDTLAVDPNAGARKVISHLPGTETRGKKQ